MGWSLTFLSPWWLALVPVIPLAWIWSLRSLSGLGKPRRAIALVLRTLVLGAVILGLAEAQLKRVSDKMTVIYLLDQSLSIPEAQRRMMVRYVNEDIEKHRNAVRQDKAGVIVFGRDAAVEFPPYAESIRVADSIESRIETDATNLAGALKLAQAALPEDSAGRIVVVCDGNENVGDARAQARRLAEAGVGIDVVPIMYAARGEVAVEKVTVPHDVNRGQPFNLNIVLNNMSPTNGSMASAPIKGKLKVVRKTATSETVLQETPVELPAGKHAFTLREEIDAADFFTYDATFTPDDRKLDGLSQNNTATAFTQVRGKGQVLLIEYVDPDGNVPGGQYDFLVERLKKENLQVTVRNTNDAFGSLGELQPFDCVILANTPRESLTEDQVKMLVRNTRELGAGLIMLGGEHSFGAGGWSGSELEAALPVDFQIRNAQVAPIGALAVVIDRSGSMSGEKLQMAVKAGQAAVGVLSPWDYVGVWAFDSSSYEVVPMQLNKNPNAIKGKISRITEGGGTEMMPALVAARDALLPLKGAAVKHMLVLTDGQSGGTGYPEIVKAMKAKGITVSTVAVGDGADVRLLQEMARVGGGRFHFAKSAKTLPRIFQQEARKISRPLIYENPDGFGVIRKYPHEMLKGIEGSPPRLTGYVRSTVKANPLVEVALVAAEPRDAGADGERYNTLLASWTYGLGKSVVWTSDAGQRWANGWSNSWPDYDRFFSQMVRWAMRPSGDTGKFQVVTEIKDGRGRLIVTALDQDDRFLNFLQFGGGVVGPNMKPLTLSTKQVAPGRYIADFDTGESGNYNVMLAPGGGIAPIITGLNVPYSAEFLDREPNEGLLRDMAALEPVGGARGEVIAGDDLTALLTHDTFRHDLNHASSRQDVWHWIVFAGACVFFFDVFNRRVMVDWGPARRTLARWRDAILRRATLPQPAVALERLKGLRAEKEHVRAQSAAAAARFEAQAGTAVETASLDRPGGDAPKPAPAKPKPAPPTATTEPEDYTSRLLKAKKKVWEDRN